MRIEGKISGNSKQALQNRADTLNEAFATSSVAIAAGAKAEILEDGRIEYTMLTRANRLYRIKVSFGKVLGLLDGKDMRAIVTAMRA